MGWNLYAKLKMRQKISYIKNMKIRDRFCPVPKDVKRRVLHPLGWQQHIFKNSHVPRPIYPQMQSSPPSFSLKRGLANLSKSPNRTSENPSNNKKCQNIKAHSSWTLIHSRWSIHQYQKVGINAKCLPLLFNWSIIKAFAHQVPQAKKLTSIGIH